MKILMLPCDYLPHSVGGREIYTHGLATRLLARGHDVRIAFHVAYGRPAPGTYRLDSLQVYALPALPEASRAETYACAPSAVPGYKQLLEEFRPDVVHMHDFSYGVGIPHLELARASGARTVMTYHSPGQSCLQRSLLYKGRTPCDGHIDLVRCTECRLTVNGAPSFLAAGLSRIDASSLGAFAPSKVKRLVTGRKMTATFREAWRHMCRRVDRIHAYADWSFAMIVSNDAPPEKVRMFRTGLANGVATIEPDESMWSGRRDQVALRAVYWGRMTPVKGVHTLVEAVLSLPSSVKIELMLLGRASLEGDKRYLAALQDKSRSDPRIVWGGLVAPGRILDVVSTADVALVPSIWLETGPLTVLEAMRAGLPVIGSRLGGIAELVEDGKDGLLFDPGDSKVLAQILQDLSADPRKIATLKARVHSPRTMDDVASDTLSLYEETLQASTVS